MRGDGVFIGGARRRCFFAAGCEIVSIDEMTREIHPWRDLVSAE